MKTNKILCLLFLAAALCFAAGTVNHLLHTGEGDLSSLLLTAGCLCAAAACAKKR